MNSLDSFHIDYQPHPAEPAYYESRQPSNVEIHLHEYVAHKIRTWQDAFRKMFMIAST